MWTTSRTTKKYDAFVMIFLVQTSYIYVLMLSIVLDLVKTHNLFHTLLNNISLLFKYDLCIAESKDKEVGCVWSSSMGDTVGFGWSEEGMRTPDGSLTALSDLVRVVRWQGMGAGVNLLIYNTDRIPVSMRFFIFCSNKLNESGSNGCFAVGRGSTFLACLFGCAVPK
jgi:hypothetical protein